MITHEHVDYRKSTYSGGDNGSQCVEVAHQPTRAHIRDSKNPEGGRLAMSPVALAGLVDWATR